MNILYIDHYAGSSKLGRSYRPYYLGKEWSKKGIKLTIVAGSYSHLRVKNPKPGISYEDNIQYIWLWTPKYKGNGFGRIFSMLVFMMQLFLNIPRIIKISKPDNIIASTVYMLDIFPAYLIKKILRSKPKLIFELHDIWPMSPKQIGNMSKYHPFILILSFVEFMVYKLCDRVISILPNSFKYMKQFGISEKQFFHIPNGIVIEESKNTKLNDNILQKKLDLVRNLKKQDAFLVGYAGAHSIANALYNLLDAAAIVKSKPIYFIFMGTGSEKKSLERYIKQNRLTNIFFLGSIPKKFISLFLKEMSILYIGLNDKPVFQYGISPNKIFDYMMSSRPIISAINSKNTPIEQAECGFTISPDSPIKLAELIEELSLKNKDELDEIGARGKKFVKKHHQYDKLANKFLKALK